MFGSVEVTAPMPANYPDNLIRTGSLSGIPGEKKYKAYTFTRTFSDSDYGKTTASDIGNHSIGRKIILPYMTRLQSPARVTYTTDVTGKERSRVSEQTRSAIFNYKPLKRKDQPFLTSRLRAPEATLTSSHHCSPWMTVTKTDYGFPGSNSELSNAGCACDRSQQKKVGPLNRSVTDLGLKHITTESGVDQKLSNTNIERFEQIFKKDDKRNELDNKTELNNTELDKKTEGSVHVNDGKEMPKQESRDKSGPVEKRVTINTPSKMSNSMPSLNTSMPNVNICKQPNMIAPMKVKATEIKGPSTYYNGYLPPENAEEIAEKLRLRPSSERAPMNRTEHRNMLAPTLYHKPLIGDRTAFMRGDKHRIFRPHIGQISHQDANNQKAGHFSAYKERQGMPASKSKKPFILETIRYQQQHAAPGTRAALYKTPTAIELYDRQREKTLHIKNMAQEKLKK